MKNKIDARIADWMRKLIDLTRRNRLLFFKPSRSSTLRVLQPSPQEIFRRLAEGKKPWRFFQPPEQEENEAGTTEGTAAHLQPLPPLRANIPTTSPNISRSLDELLCDTGGMKKLNDVLRNLYRRSRSDYEERGIRILHVSFGTLRWKEKETGEVTASPLTLLPVELSRPSAKDSYKLSTVEEDIVVNPALQVKLWNDFRIELPPIPESEDEISVDAYLAKITRLVKRLAGWSVVSECWIGLFSFHKLVIYQDLNNNGNLIKQRPLVQALAGEADLSNPGNQPDPRELDKLVVPKESYLILDADSSQLAAIEAAKLGMSLIIQGPPGTGKSQTISNLIAESIAAGRTVLFMSEKMAALEVVYKRLREANLGQYCLELHSHKANKREVVNELHRCYLESLQPKTFMTDAEFEKLIQRRDQLNEYVNALHQIHEPLGETPFQVLGKLAELASTPFVPGGSVPKLITTEFLDSVSQLGQDLGHVWKVVEEGIRFPWFACTISSYGVETRATLQTRLITCFDVCRELGDESQRIAEQFGLVPPDSHAKTRWLLQLAEKLNQGPGVEPAWLTSPKLDPLISDAQRYRRLSSKWKALREQLRRNYTEAFFELSGNLKEHLERELANTSSFVLGGAADSSQFASDRKLVLTWLRSLVGLLQDWKRDADALSSFLGLQVAKSIHDCFRIIQITELCGESDRPDSSWLQPKHLDLLNELLPDIQLNYEKRTTMRSEILAEYSEEFLSLDLPGFLDAMETRYSSFFRWLMPGYYKIRRQIKRCRRDRKSPLDLMQDLRKAISLMQFEAKLETDSPRVKNLLGEWYRGYETNFSRVNNAKRVAKQLLELTGGCIPEKLIQRAALGSLLPPEIQQVTCRLRKSLEEWEASCSTVKKHIPFNRIPTTRLPLRETEYDQVSSWATALTQALRVVDECLDQIEHCLSENLQLSCLQAVNDLKNLGILRELESQVLMNRSTYMLLMVTASQG